MERNYLLFYQQWIKGMVIEAIQAIVKKQYNRII